MKSSGMYQNFVRSTSYLTIVEATKLHSILIKEN
jgi:hypothetical protein